MGGLDADAADALAAVADERRLHIVEALVAARAERPDDPGLSFSALRRRSGIEDKGNFNYHLGVLRHDYVEKADDGYHLTPAGSELAGLLVSSIAREPYEGTVAGEPCPECGEDVVVRLASGRARVSCPADHVPFETSVPPGAAAGRDPAELLAMAADRWQQAVAQHVAGYCVQCSGPEVGTFERDDDAAGYHYRSRCSRCGLQFGVTPGCVVVRHPAVVSLHYHHGRDVRRTPPWKLPFLDPDAAEVVTTDPLRIRVPVAVEGDRVALTVDRDGDVVEVAGP